MASAQEAKEFIQNLNGNAADQGNRVESSAKRLLFEILRFISNKTFLRASAANEPTFILFKNYADRIVIDCNHDDFSMGDIQAICQPCDEKQGMGASFRSILIATKKVHIHSGNVSLEFESQPSTTFTEALKPVWVMPTETVPNNLSRITLYIYHQDGEDKLRKVVASQFDKLKEPCIIFLRDLLSMTVESYDKDGNVYHSKKFRKYHVDEYRVSVKVTTVYEGLEKTHAQLYHVTEQSAEGQQKKAMLAFPLSDKLEVQASAGACGLFNFVQLRGSPLPFHVHSDFDFDDQRGPLPLSTHLTIRDLIPSAFFQAVLEFCEHPNLRYHWPLFLMPGMKDSDAIWSSLEADTRNWIAHNPVLISRNHKHWRHISHLTILVADAQDEAGDPLLDDRITDPYLSNTYPLEAIEKLESYGLANFGSDQLLNLLESRSDVPWDERRKIHPINWNGTHWSEAFTRLVSKTLLNRKQLERIMPTALAHKQNEDLVYYVRSSILDEFSTSNDMPPSETKRYLVYFYLTHQPSFFTDRQPYNSLKVMTIEMQLVQPQHTIVYMPSMDHPYGPEILLGSDFSFQDGHFYFLHQDILTDEPTAPGIFHPSWKNWLCDYLGIRQRLSLVRPRAFITPQSSRVISFIGETDALSEELRFVLEKRPDRFLGFIQYLWAFDGPRVMKSPSFVAEIRDLPARDLCTGNDSLKLHETRALHETWVPLNVLREKVRHYMESPDAFPFLNLGNEGSMDMAIHIKWNFLVKDLGVNSQDNTTFLLEILHSIKLSSDVLSSWQTKKVLELYSAINTRLQLEIEGEKELTLDFFQRSGVLYIDETGPIWTGLSSCRWKAPANPTATYYFESFLGDKDAEQQQMDCLSDLFRVGMSVTDVSVKGLVEELLVLRNEGCEDVAQVTEIYKYLNETISRSDEIRTGFEGCAVILVHKDGRSMWLTTSQCFWSEADTTPLNSSLKTCYPSLKSFFIDKLGIKVSAYDKLLESSTDAKGSWKVQGLLLSLMDETTGSLNEFPLAPMQKAKIFKVDNPQSRDELGSELCSVDTEFAIGDRPEFQCLLAYDIKMLDCDLKTVRRLQPLFRWLSIEDRYLSRCVTERLDDVLTSSSIPYNLRDKAYQIARVGETFNIYGSRDDACSLYEQLQKAKLVEAVVIWTRLEVRQDGQTITSRSKHLPSTWILDSDEGLTIHVAPDANGQQRSLVSTLPERLQEWLMKDICGSSGINRSEVTNVLTSIFNTSGPDLDRILWEQGIVEVPFENLELKRKKALIKVRFPEVDEREPRIVTR